MHHLNRSSIEFSFYVKIRRFLIRLLIINNKLNVRFFFLGFVFSFDFFCLFVLFRWGFFLFYVFFSFFVFLFFILTAAFCVRGLIYLVKAVKQSLHFSSSRNDVNQGVKNWLLVWIVGV